MFHIVLVVLCRALLSEFVLLKDAQPVKANEEIVIDPTIAIFLIVLVFFFSGIFVAHILTHSYYELSNIYKFIIILALSHFTILILIIGYWLDMEIRCIKIADFAINNQHFLVFSTPLRQQVPPI